MLRIATCQMTSGPDIGANVQIAESLIRKAAREGANLALLPEMFTIMSNDPKDVLRLAEQYQDGPVQRIMSGLAKSLGIWIAAGTMHSVRKLRAMTRFIFFLMKDSRNATTSRSFMSEGIRPSLSTSH